MNKSSRLKELFFNNLLLLGFDKAAIENEYRVTCDKNMFTLPNQKMFEVVTHFLFSKLEGKYVLPWPLFDKDVRRQFQKLTFNYLSSIAQESNVKFPRMTPSCLSTFSGDRFYEVYVAFSSHVVEQEIRANGNVDLILQPKVSSLNCKNVAETLKIEIVLSTEKFKRLQKISLEYFEEILECAKGFSLLIKKLKSTLMANSTKSAERLTHLCSLSCENSISEEKSNLMDSFKKGMEFENKVKKQWALLENFLLKEKELWRYLCSEVEENSEKFILDSTHIKVTVPDILAKEHEELNAIEASSIVSENGKLDLLRYMKLFIIFLESYLKSYSKGEMSNIHNHCNVKETLSLDESLDEMKRLNEKIVRDVLSNLKESTENLHETLLAKEFSEDLEALIKECPSWNIGSKSFHERIESIRSDAIFLFSDENPKSSLLSSESSTETGLSLDKLSCSTELFEASGCSDNFSAEECNLTINLEPIKSPEESSSAHKNQPNLKEIIFEGTLLETICKVNADTTNEHFHKNMLSDDFQDDYLQETVVTTAIPPLPDMTFDFDYSKPIKMRESWLTEDSLQAMTLPDDVILD